MAKKEEKIKNQDSKKENKNKKSFFKSFKAELKKVVWPTPKQLVNNTTAVIVIVLLTAIIVFMLDFVFEAINKGSVNIVKSIVQTTEESDNNTTDGSEEANTTEETETTESTENTEGTENAEGQTENNSETTENTENQENNQ